MPSLWTCRRTHQLKNREMNLFVAVTIFRWRWNTERIRSWAENIVDGDAINLFDILSLFRLNDGGFG